VREVSNGNVVGDVAVAFDIHFQHICRHAGGARLLRTRVFPELEERLRARRHNLEWVDLRVGVATASERDERVRELYVLKVCLDEVQRCRPYLIVLLGDRYGWVPPEERVKAAAEEAGIAAVIGRSVTDMKIDFGMLSDPEQQPRSFFYFRGPLPYTQMPKEIAALYCEDYAADAGKSDRKRRLAELKQRIERQQPNRVRHYSAQWDLIQQRVSGLEDWGRVVLDDIWSELERETRPFAAAADTPLQQAEREALEDFINDRAHDFVGRQSILDSLTGLATAAESASGLRGASITGDPGSGKSALFGALYRRLRGGDVFLLAHAAGARLCGGWPPATFLFSGIGGRRVRADDGARAIGAAADVGFAWSGRRRWCRRAHRATGSSTTIAKFCSTDNGSLRRALLPNFRLPRPRSLSLSAAAR
jgi:hypothetical protein